MRKSIVRPRSVLAVLALTGLAGGGVAYAYPPGTALTVSAVRVGAPKQKAAYSVTVANVQPGCTVKVTLDEGSATAVAGPSGTVVVILTVSAEDNETGTIKAVTSNCSAIESAKTKVSLKRGHLEGPGKVKRNKPFTIEAENYPPNTPITFTATKGSKTVVVTVTSDATGHAYGVLSLPDKYAWAIVGAGGGEAHTWWVQVS